MSASSRCLESRPLRNAEILDRSCRMTPGLVTPRSPRARTMASRGLSKPRPPAPGLTRAEHFCGALSSRGPLRSPPRPARAKTACETRARNATGDARGNDGRYRWMSGRGRRVCVLRRDGRSRSQNDLSCSPPDGEARHLGRPCDRRGILQVGPATASRLRAGQHSGGRHGCR